MSRGHDVNYPVIFKFALFLYLLKVLVSALLAFVFGDNLEAEMGLFVFLASVADFFVSLLVYMYIGLKQKDKPYIYSLLVTVVVWCVAIPVDFSINAYHGVPFEPQVYLIDFSLAVFEVSIGTLTGIEIRNKRVINES